MAATTRAARESGANLQTALMDVPDVYLRCRDTRHWFNETTPLHIAEKTRQGDIVLRHLKCENCETEKTDRYLLRSDRYGVQRLERLGSHYAYPEGYLMPAMAQAEHPRELLRYEMFRRAVGGEVPKARKLKVAK